MLAIVVLLEDAAVVLMLLVVVAELLVRELVDCLNTLSFVPLLPPQPSPFLASPLQLEYIAE